MSKSFGLFCLVYGKDSPPRYKGPIQCRNIYHLHIQSLWYFDVIHTFPFPSPRASPPYLSVSVLIKPQQDHHFDLPVHTGFVPFIVQGY